MDPDLNNLNQFLGDHDSFHFPTSTHDKNLRKSSLDMKQPEYMISPINNAYTLKVFTMQSPSPFKQSLNFYEQDQSDSHDHHQISSLDPRKKCINHVLNFQESPRKKPYTMNTASSQRITNRNPQLSIISSSSREEKKNSKGLRNLSESVYKIVLDLKVTTYKQVADHLVRMLNSGQFGPIDQPNSKAKDEQNIKRRVYDALNVLISADVLKKNGKFVISDQQVLSQRVKLPNKGGKKDDSVNLYDQIVKKELNIKQKKDKVEELKNKKQILNAILKRNRKKKHLQKQKILFPIVGITYKKTLPKIVRNESHSRVSLPLSNIVQVVGDMDLLVKVGIDVLNQNIQQIIEEDNQDEVEADQGRSKKGKSQPLMQTKQKITRVLYFL